MKVELALKRAKEPGIEWVKLDKPHPVTGVGNDIVYAKWWANIPIKLPGGGRTTYKCLYMDDISCPALLGMHSLQSAGAILDLRKDHLCMYSGDTKDIKISCRGDVTKMKLEQSSTGHILLPCAQFEKKNCRNTNGPY